VELIPLKKANKIQNALLFQNPTFATQVTSK
jgi:hypothetical protein